MKTKNRETNAFFKLVQAGLWEDSTVLSESAHYCFNDVNWIEVYRLAEEQSVVGLLAAGIDLYKNLEPKFSVQQEVALQFIGATLQLEQRNEEMNLFVEDLFLRMRKADIYTLLVKGQGVAQCYARPLWRASGDIDLYMSDSNFPKAKQFFKPIVDSIDPDNDYDKNINMHYGPWVIEIHENQYCSLSSRINKVLDQVHVDLFNNGSVRSWLNGKTQIFLPSADNDVIIVFTHFIKHFYKGGLGVRQICDWSRLLWIFRDKLDLKLLENRVKDMGLMTEWKAFGAFAVDFLGMSPEAIPFYDNSKKWSRKASRIKDFLIEVGNFGHNRDTSYYSKHPFMLRKAISFGRRCGDLLHHARIFPLDSFRFLVGITLSGLRAVSHGE